MLDVDNWYISMCRGISFFLFFFYKLLQSVQPNPKSLVTKRWSHFNRMVKTHFEKQGNLGRLRMCACKEKRIELTKRQRNHEICRIWWLVYMKPEGSTISLHKLFVLWECFVSCLKGKIWSALLIRWCARKLVSLVRLY